MIQSNREQFLKDIISELTWTINKMLVTIDVTKSECFKAQNREHIFEIVQKEVGASKINSMIFKPNHMWGMEANAKAAAIKAAFVSGEKCPHGVGILRQCSIGDPGCDCRIYGAYRKTVFFPPCTARLSGLVYLANTGWGLGAFLAAGNVGERLQPGFS